MKAYSIIIKSITLFIFISMICFLEQVRSQEAEGGLGGYSSSGGPTSSPTNPPTEEPTQDPYVTVTPAPTQDNCSVDGFGTHACLANGSAVITDDGAGNCSGYYPGIDGCDGSDCSTTATFPCPTEDPNGLGYIPTTPSPTVIDLPNGGQIIIGAGFFNAINVTRGNVTISVTGTNADQGTFYNGTLINQYCMQSPSSDNPNTNRFYMFLSSLYYDDSGFMGAPGWYPIGSPYQPFVSYTNDTFPEVANKVHEFATFIGTPITAWGLNAGPRPLVQNGSGSASVMRLVSASGNSSNEWIKSLDTKLESNPLQKMFSFAFGVDYSYTITIPVAAGSYRFSIIGIPGVGLTSADISNLGNPKMKITYSAFTPIVVNPTGVLNTKDLSGTPQNMFNSGDKVRLDWKVIYN